jgi:Tol biopolymer transport system component
LETPNAAVPRVPRVLESAYTPGMNFWRLLMLFSLGAITAFAAAGCGGGAESQPRIIYEARKDNVTNLFTIDAKTGTATQVTFGTGFDGNPAWSPDHRRIVFSSDRDSEPLHDDVYVMNADGSGVRRLTSTPDMTEWSAKFSPDASEIVYVQSTGEGGFIALMNADGSDVRRLAGPYKFAEFPSWRRDGAEIYFSAIAEGRSDADIYSVNPRTLEVKTRISTPSADVCPHFTHDGKTLTYATGTDQYAENGDGSGVNVDLYAHDLSSDDTTGKSDYRLTNDLDVDDYGNPSPDDKTFVFIARRDGNAELYLMDRDGEHQRRLTTTEDVQENVPDW